MQQAILAVSADGHIGGNAHQQAGNNGVSFHAPVAQLRQVDPPESKNDALVRHQQNQQRVYGVLNHALNTPLPQKQKASRARLLKNTAELIRDGFLHARVLTLTHVTENLRPGGDLAFFDETVNYPNFGGDYNDDWHDVRIRLRAGHVEGEADQMGNIRLYDPSCYDDNDLITVLIHESQHQADFHRPNESFEAPALDEYGTAHAVNGYQTEFRAYWQGGWLKTYKTGVTVDRLGYSFMEAKNDKKVPSGSFFVPDFQTHFKNQRQANIFWHLIQSDSYAYVLAAYQNSQAFREMVDNYTMPTGGNLLNSTRIESMRSQVERINFQRRMLNLINIEGGGTQLVVARQRLNAINQINQSVTQLNNLRNVLEREDIEFLGDRAQSEPFWMFVERKLGVEEAEQLYDFISGRVHVFHDMDFYNNLYNY